MNKHGKTLTFDDFRATYDPRNEAIILTSGDKELAKYGWRIVLQSHTPGERVLRAHLQEQGIIRVGEQLPGFLVAPKVDEHRWWEFPLGLTYRGKEVIMPLIHSTSHALIVGPTGTGKSIVQRAILRHVASTMGKWDVLGIDLKQVELNEYAAQPALHENFTHATTLEAAVAGLRTKRELMHRRYEFMKRAGLAYATDSISAGTMRAQLILVDELWPLLVPEAAGPRADWGERELLQAEATALLGEIARLGKAAHVHLVLGTQRLDLPDDSPGEHKVSFPGELRANLINRIACGRVNWQTSAALFDSAAAEQLPQVKGRGLVRFGDAEAQEVQFYHTAMGDFYLG